MKDTSPGFTPDTVRFLRQLKRNNDRDWFEKNRGRYESALRDPCRSFIDALKTPLGKEFPGVRADYRSISRIYRDTRFSDDKSPYKNWVGFSLKDRALPAEVGPSLWIGFDPTGIAYGCGSYAFSKPVREHFRERVTQKPTDRTFREAVRRASKAGFEPRGRDLKRTPIGYPADHPNADFLLYNGLYLVKEIDFPSSFFQSPETFARECVKSLKPCLSFFQWMRESAATSPRDARRFLDGGSIQTG